MAIATHDLISELNQLIEVDYDAVAAYQAAADRLEDADAREQLRDFMADHERHTLELSDAVRRLGGRPATGADLKSVLTKGKVLLANLAGDKAILRAMKSNEDDTNHACERALQSLDLGAEPELRELLRRNLADERRHRAWIVHRLDSA